MARKTKSIEEYEQQIFEIFGVAYQLSNPEDNVQLRRSRITVTCPIHLNEKRVTLNNILSANKRNEYFLKYGKYVNTFPCKECQKQESL
jgi:hypothetical protein